MEIIPGLPDELALLCLARLPRRLHPLASTVSRSWRHAFRSHALLSIRRRLGAYETWLIIGGRSPLYWSRTCKYSWWLVDTTLCSRCDPVSRPPVRLMDYDAAGAQGEILLAANRLLAGSITTPMEEIGRFDVFGKQWRSPSPPNMLTRRRCFASAYLDGYTYVAGGTIWDCIVRDGGASDVTNRSLRPLNSVERLNCTTIPSAWERLPNMHVGRIKAGGVVLNDSFCVIGGYDGAGNNIYSGEMWDVRSQKWILVPELWPCHIFKDCFAGSLDNVVAVMGTLFAINQEWEVQAELMVYNLTFKVWTSLGLIPVESFYEDSADAKVMAKFAVFSPVGVGKELWLLVHGRGGFDSFFIACSPLIPGGASLSWRRLPYTFPCDTYLGLAVTI